MWIPLGTPPAFKSLLTRSDRTRSAAGPVRHLGGLDAGIAGARRATRRRPLAGRIADRLARHSPGLLRLSLIPLLVVLGACAMGQVAYDYSKEPDPRSREYIIGPSDLVRVTVWGNPDLTTETRVRPDGTMTVQLVGDMRAAGRTPSDMKKELTQRYSSYIKQEALNVTVGVVEVRSYEFTVSGNAERPGRYGANNYITVLEAVTMAGGPNRFAETKRIRILRRSQGGNVRQIPIDYETLKKGERLDQNIVVLSGDTIVIP